MKVSEWVPCSEGFAVHLMKFQQRDLLLVAMTGGVSLEGGLIPLKRSLMIFRMKNSIFIFRKYLKQVICVQLNS